MDPSLMTVEQRVADERRTQVEMWGLGLVVTLLGLIVLGAMLHEHLHAVIK